MIFLKSKKMIKHIFIYETNVDHFQNHANTLFLLFLFWPITVLFSTVFSEDLLITYNFILFYSDSVKIMPRATIFPPYINHKYFCSVSLFSFFL